MADDNENGPSWKQPKRARKRDGDRELAIEPTEALDVRVRARQTWKTQGLTLRVRWPRAEVTRDAAARKVGAK